MATGREHFVRKYSNSKMLHQLGYPVELTMSAAGLIFKYIYYSLASSLFPAYLPVDQL